MKYAFSIKCKQFLQGQPCAHVFAKCKRIYVYVLEKSEACVLDFALCVGDTYSASGLFVYMRALCEFDYLHAYKEYIYMCVCVCVCVCAYMRTCVCAFIPGLQVAQSIALSSSRRDSSVQTASKTLPCIYVSRTLLVGWGPLQQ